MKIFKYVLYTLLILVLIFISFGLLKPTVSYGHEIVVNKSIKEAWAVSQDPSKLGEWLEGFKSIELISGDKGTVGSKYKVVVNPGEGQEDFEMTETLISIYEFNRVTFHFDSEFMDFEQTMSFKESDGKTTVATDSKVKGKSLVMRSMFAIMETLGGSFTSQEVKNIEKLKGVIESNTTDYYPLQKLIDTDAMQIK